MIAAAKARGLRISCDTAPPYFALNDLAVGDYRTFGKLVPPLRRVVVVTPPPVVPPVPGSDAPDAVVPVVSPGRRVVVVVPGNHRLCHPHAADAGGRARR